MHKATTFEHGGKVYEVRAIPTLNGWKVRIFVEGIPANGFTYSVDSEVYQDAAIDGVGRASVIFGAALPRNWWPPKRLPTTISRRKTINSNHEITPWRSCEIQKRPADAANTTGRAVAKPSRAAFAGAVLPSTAGCGRSV
jgi:hypothetical protein